MGGGGVIFVVHGSNDAFDGEHTRAEGGKNSRPRCRRVGREDVTCWFSHDHWRLGGVHSAGGTTHAINPPRRSRVGLSATSVTTFFLTHLSRQVLG